MQKFADNGVEETCDIVKRGTHPNSSPPNPPKQDRHTSVHEILHAPARLMYHPMGCRNTRASITACRSATSATFTLGTRTLELRRLSCYPRSGISKEVQSHWAIESDARGEQCGTDLLTDPPTSDLLEFQCPSSDDSPHLLSISTPMPAQICSLPVA